ncbi:HD-GYP domain-containing protein [Bellilinea sp.]|uniref:HD-GYP domain-containing protein n=1 Tax=Bellilinea sp. TaxID=2838785 RepID=UPI002ADDE584|nr:HD-GYP domain-containing protein [Bellilinea sp.]
MITGNLYFGGDFFNRLAKLKTPLVTEVWGETGDLAAQWLQVEGSSSLLFEIVVKAVELLEVKHCQVLVLCADGTFHRQAYYQAQTLLSRSNGVLRNYQRLNHFLQRVALSDGPVLIGYRDTYLGAEERRLLKLQSNENLVLIPMRLESEPVGIFGLSFDRFHSIEQRLPLAMMFSEQAAQAIQREGLALTEEESAVEIVLALAKALESRDLSTGSHCRRVTRTAEQVALRMGCTFREIQDIRRAALLHDIGKIGIPDQILHKPGPLSEREWAIMRQHPEIGARILRLVHGLTEVARLVLAHHEHYDGSGYPYGLSGDAIPLGARILTVVDAFSAMTTDRIYRPALSYRDAIAELKRCAGTDFDPRVVDVFLEMLKADSDGMEDVG